MKNAIALMSCELCARDLDNLTVHHLIPRQKTKRQKAPPSPTINICSACHRQIHALYDNRRLAEDLNTLEKLQNAPEMAKFLAWVRKQKAHRRIQVHSSAKD